MEPLGSRQLCISVGPENIWLGADIPDGAFAVTSQSIVKAAFAMSVTISAQQTFTSWPQVRVTWEEGPILEKISPPDWPGGKSGGHFLE